MTIHNPHYECGQCGSHFVLVTLVKAATDPTFDKAQWRVECSQGHPVVGEPGMSFALGSDEVDRPRTWQEFLKPYAYGLPALIYVDDEQGDGTLMVTFADRITPEELARMPRLRRRILAAYVTEALARVREADHRAELPMLARTQDARAAAIDEIVTRGG